MARKRRPTYHEVMGGGKFEYKGNQLHKELLAMCGMVLDKKKLFEKEQVLATMYPEVDLSIFTDSENTHWDYIRRALIEKRKEKLIPLNKTWFTKEWAHANKLSLRIKNGEDLATTLGKLAMRSICTGKGRQVAGWATVSAEYPYLADAFTVLRKNVATGTVKSLDATVGELAKKKVGVSSPGVLELLS